MSRRLPIVVLMSVAALLVAAATAPAAAPLRGALYEGSAPRGGQDVNLQVSANGKRVRYLNFGIRPGCRRGGKTLNSASRGFGPRNLKIRNGRFSYRRVMRFPATGGREEDRITGRFLDSGRRFTATVRSTLHNPQTRIRCDSGKVRIGGRVPLRTLVNRSWVGTTAQGAPVRLTITPAGITTLAADVTVPCRNGEMAVLSAGPVTEPVRVDDDGSFRHSVTPRGAVVVTNGRAERTRITGTIAAKGFLVRPTPEDSDGTVDCDRVEIPFEARPTG